MARKKSKALTTKTFTPEIQTPIARKRRLQQLILQINQSVFMQCLALQEIRDHQLYLENNNQIMDDFLNSSMISISPTNANRMLGVIDNLGNNDNIAELMQNHDLLALTEMIHDEKITEVKPGDAKIVYLDGTEVDLETQVKLIEKQAAQNVEKEIQKQKRDTDKSKKLIKELKEQQKHLNQDAEEQIAELNRKMEALGKMASIDPKELVIIAEKKAAKKIILTAFGEISTHLSYLSQVPQELRDPGMAASIEQILVALETGTKGLREDWNAHLYAATQG